MLIKIHDAAQWNSLSLTLIPHLSAAAFTDFHVDLPVADVLKFTISPILPLLRSKKRLISVNYIDLKTDCQCTTGPLCGFLCMCRLTKTLWKILDCKTTDIMVL